jgi:predicted branched-subunit amino acid permease
MTYLAVTVRHVLMGLLLCEKLYNNLVSLSTVNKLYFSFIILNFVFSYFK